MVIEEMTDRECRVMLARTNLARLACALNNQPYVVPIHVDFHDAHLYGFATLGQKTEWMRQNPLGCLEIDEITTYKQWASVVVLGAYEELPDTPEYQCQRSVAERLFQRHPVWWEPASVSLAGHQPRSPIMFRILITRMTGRRAGPKPPETPYLLTIASDEKRPRWLARVLRRLLGSRALFTFYLLLFT